MICGRKITRISKLFFALCRISLTSQRRDLIHAISSSLVREKKGPRRAAVLNYHQRWIDCSPISKAGRLKMRQFRGPQVSAKLLKHAIKKPKMTSRPRSSSQQKFSLLTRQKTIVRQSRIKREVCNAFILMMPGPRQKKISCHLLNGTYCRIISFNYFSVHEDLLKSLGINQSKKETIFSTKLIRSFILCIFRLHRIQRTAQTGHNMTNCYLVLSFTSLTVVLWFLLLLLQVIRILQK